MEMQRNATEKRNGVTLADVNGALIMMYVCHLWPGCALSQLLRIVIPLAKFEPQACASAVARCGVSSSSVPGHILPSPLSHSSSGPHDTPGHASLRGLAPPPISNLKFAACLSHMSPFGSDFSPLSLFHVDF